MRLPLQLSARRTADFIGICGADLGKRNEHSGRNAYNTVMNVLNVKKALSVPEWSKLNSIFASPGFAYNAFNAIMKKECGLAEAKKLKSALEKSNPLSPITKAQMLRAYGFFASECSEQDIKFVKDTIDDVLSKFPVLTTELSIYLLGALISAPSWKEQADLIIKSTGAEVNHRMLCLYALLAFEHKEFDLGWETMTKAMNTGTNFLPSLYNCIVENHKLYPEKNLIFKLLDFLEENSYMMSSHAAENLSNVLNASDKYVARFATVDIRGHCLCCNRKLQRLPLTAEEHQKLLIDIEERFNLQCKYNTYEQEEVTRFKEFLGQCPQYSIVIDGLNMLYRAKATTPQVISNQVRVLEKQGHKILVIGRSHLRGNKTFLKVFKGHMLYFLNDRTKDDTFTIYSALFNGQNTLVLSNDFFGTYYNSIKSGNKHLFRKWQLTNHIVGTGYRGMFGVLPSFSPVCQTSEDGSSIHVPLVTDDQYKSFAPYAWLCIQRVTKEEKKEAWRKWPQKTFVHEIDAKSGVDAFKVHAHSVKSNFQEEKKYRRSHVQYH